MIGWTVDAHVWCKKLFAVGINMEIDSPVSKLNHILSVFTEQMLIQCAVLLSESVTLIHDITEKQLSASQLDVLSNLTEFRRITSHIFFLTSNFRRKAKH